MKLIRFGPTSDEQPGIFHHGVRRDCSKQFSDWDGDFFANDGIQRLRDLVDSGKALPRVPEKVRWAAPIARPWKVLCIGLNYRDHAEESGMDIPEEPIVFTKGSNCVVGPYDDLRIPREGAKTDWEVELGVVIGQTARYLETPEAAKACIAGYAVSHDVSERAFQLERGGQWVKGKSCDTFNPLGPWLVTPEEVGDVMDLSLHLSVNGTTKQTGSTRTMIFDVNHLVWYLSQFMTLEPGDLINTGTPPGVGFARTPPEFLRAGDTVELRIEKLGCQGQTCIPA